MRNVKSWAAVFAAMAVAFGGLVVAPTAAAAPSPVPVVSEGGAGGAAARSGNSYALVVAKAARKAAAKKLGVAPLVSKAHRMPLDVPSKNARWFAGTAVNGRTIAWPDDESYSQEISYTVSVVHKALRQQLARRGFSRVYSDADAHLRIYRNRTYVCQVERAGIACARHSSVKKVKNFAAKLYKALPASQRGYLVSISTVGTKVEKGATKGYLTFVAGLNIPGPYSGAYGMFYKAPGKRWKFAYAGQDIPNCSDLERTKDSRKAYAGEFCMRGNVASVAKR